MAQVSQNDVRFLIEKVKEGNNILTAGVIHEMVPTIHDMVREGTVTPVDHLGFGFFQGANETGKFNFDGGGAMKRLETVSWTYLRGEGAEAFYNRQRVLDALNSLLE